MEMIGHVIESTLGMAGSIHTKAQVSQAGTGGLHHTRAALRFFGLADLPASRGVSGLILRSTESETMFAARVDRNASTAGAPYLAAAFRIRFLSRFFALRFTSCSSSA